MLARMVAVGERSGRLGEMLSKAALLQEREAQRAARKLAAYAEAGLIVAVAGVVLFLALGVFSPMWELTRLATGR
ncbi:MAG: type II secretion system F family protein [Nitrospinae bacterium]|nr:type II secretion system F family protein [Nitrospinota bacterium]